MPTLRLQDEGFEVILWYMNPNIQPLMEYMKRREALWQCAERLGVRLLCEDDAWDISKWLALQLPRATSPERCHWCCASRVEKTHAKAHELGMDYFSSSLLYSRYQPHEVIARSGHECQSHIKFVYRDFRQDWQAGIDKARAWDIYRQPYCGCVFSEAERYAKKFARLKKRPDTDAKSGATV